MSEMWERGLHPGQAEVHDDPRGPEDEERARRPRRPRAQRLSLPVDEARRLSLRADRINDLARTSLVSRELTNKEMVEIAEDSAYIVSELERRLATWDKTRRLD